jgi:hypothetical protein
MQLHCNPEADEPRTCRANPGPQQKVLAFFTHRRLQSARRKLDRYGRSRSIASSTWAVATAKLKRMK